MIYYDLLRVLVGMYGQAITRSFPTKRMFMKPNKSMKIGDYRENGVWVLKLKEKTLEMEFDLDPLGNEYLLYQVLR